MKEPRERERIRRGFPLLLFRFLINTFRNDGYGDDRVFRNGGKKEGGFLRNFTLTLTLSRQGRGEKSSGMTGEGLLR